MFDCCRYLKDRTVGGEGRPLTRSGIIVAPGGGTTIAIAKLPEATANTPPGLEAGAYSNTNNAVGGARGVSYRTFRNVSTVAKTFRVNAVSTARLPATAATRQPASMRSRRRVLPMP